MHKYHFNTFLFLLILGFSCRSAKEFPTNDSEDQIHFGQGGGFSGIVTHYVLLEDGRLFQKENRDTTYTLVDTWPPDFTTQMFNNYQLLGLDKVNDYEPGDLYYFIEYHSPKKEIHRIGWGRPGFTPDDNVVKFYNLLYKSTKPKQ
jgi:hypothetical protein